MPHSLKGHENTAPSWSAYEKWCRSGSPGLKEPALGHMPQLQPEQAPGLSSKRDSETGSQNPFGGTSEEDPQ